MFRIITNKTGDQVIRLSWYNQRNAAKKTKYGDYHSGWPHQNLPHKFQYHRHTPRGYCQDRFLQFCNSGQSWVNLHHRDRMVQ